MSEPYRLHERGPVHVLHHDRPGWVEIEMRFERAGDHVRGHAHAFDHVMRVTDGILRAELDGAETIVRAGGEMLIPKGARHGLMALASGTVAWCSHEIRRENGEIDPEAFSPEGVPVEWVRRLTVPAC